MPERCEGCPINCCLDFKITSEAVDPEGLKKRLQKYPYIKKVGIKPIIGPRGKTMAVGGVSL